MNDIESIVKQQGNVAFHIHIRTNLCDRLTSPPKCWFEITKLWYPTNDYKPYGFINGVISQYVAEPIFKSKNTFLTQMFFDVSNFDTIVKKEVETVIGKIRETDEHINHVTIGCALINSSHITNDTSNIHENTMFKIERLLEDEFGDSYKPSIEYCAKCVEICKDKRITCYENKIAELNDTIDNLRLMLKPIESAEYTADWKSEIGKVFNIKVGETYAGVKHKRKTVIKIIKDGDYQLIVYKSDESVYGIEPIESFCYQIHLGNEK